jgi:cell division protein FtsB
MKKITIALVLLAVIFIVGCQTPQDMKAQLDKQVEQIKQLETKITEHAATIEQLKTDLAKIMTDYYKGKTPTSTTPSTPSTPQTPTRVGR